MDIQNCCLNVDFLGMKIITVQYYEELEKFHEICNRTNDKALVSDIYESPISFSFRVYDSINRITKTFYQCIKDDAL